MDEEIGVRSKVGETVELDDRAVVGTIVELDTGLVMGDTAEFEAGEIELCGWGFDDVSGADELVVDAKVACASSAVVGFCCVLMPYCDSKLLAAALGKAWRRMLIASVVD